MLECVLIIESDLDLFLANLTLTTLSLITGSFLCQGAKVYWGKGVTGSTICFVDFHRVQTEIPKFCITCWSHCKTCSGLSGDALCLGRFVNLGIQRVIYSPEAYRYVPGVCPPRQSHIFSSYMVLLMIKQSHQSMRDKYGKQKPWNNCSLPHKWGFGLRIWAHTALWVLILDSHLFEAYPNLIKCLFSP